MRKARHELFRWGLLGLLLLATPQAGMGREVSPRFGTLRVEGEAIERLVLQDSAKQLKVFYWREPNLSVPAGTYRLDEVILQGEYSGRLPWRGSETRVVKIEPGQIVTLKLGAPLRQTIRVERWGASLVLNHQVLGQGGEAYCITRRQGAPPPAFAIYLDENQVAADRFEPG
ncbi:MAG: hypothetical protein FJ280_14805 [Planctomycetes bacterium]|nr:hypothetical protein [Planctomycetota bacterium]